MNHINTDDTLALDNKILLKIQTLDHHCLKNAAKLTISYHGILEKYLIFVSIQLIM